jgi:hypothetical protein
MEMEDRTVTIDDEFGAGDSTLITHMYSLMG